MLANDAAHGKDRRTTTTNMEHRHFATIAAIIWSEFAEREVYSKEAIAQAFADRLRGTNPKFDRQRFMRAAVGHSEG